MGIDYSESAKKHGITKPDALFAMANAIYSSTKVKLNGGDPSVPRRVFIGPQHAQTDRLIEVLVKVFRPGEFVIYHVMPLGSYYRQQMEEDQ